MAGDREADVFDGLVVTTGVTGPRRYVAAERVTAVWPDRVQTDLSADEAAALPEYAAPRSVTRHASAGGLGSRVHAAFRDLFGRR